MYVVFLILFIQLGITYYISIQTLILFFMLKNYRLKKNVFKIGIMFMILFFLKYIYEPFVYYDLLITTREFFFFLIILFSTYGFKKINVEKTVYFFKIILIMIFIFILVQKISIVFMNTFPRIPMDLFIMNQETLVGIEKALLYETRIRPIAFYGEPSYCAGIIIITYYIINKYDPIESKKYELLAIFSIFLLESMSGLIIISFFLISKYISSVLKKKFIVYLTLFIPIIVYLVSISEFSTRILDIFSGSSDLSTQIRLIYPFMAIIQSFIELNFFGISNSSLELYNNLSQIRDNGFLNLIMDYGIIIFFLYYYIYKRIKDKNLFILFILLNFLNGTVFSLDKAILFSLLFGISKVIKNKLIDKTI